MEPSRTVRLHLDRGSAPELGYGLAQIISEYPERFTDADRGLPVRFTGTAGLPGFRLSRDDHGLLVEYGRPCDAFRGLGVAMGSLLHSGTVPEREELTPFTNLTVMLDVSRGGVLKPDAVRALLRRFALMGITALMLYTEDTYELPGEPYFGHARGRYTPDELRAIDDVAATLGIEVIPCIQTLGHLGQVLKWPTYARLRDTGEVLLADEPDTYTLIRAMIEAASGPLRSSRIHLGMDETHGLGAGSHRLRHGLHPPFEIFNRHLHKVMAICAELDLEPMLWSDMYFRLGSKENDQYDLDALVPADVVAQIPAGVQLVYWDYWHDDPEFYAKQIDRHRDLGTEPIYAGAALTWNHLWAQNPASLRFLGAGMTAAHAKGLNEVMLTIWGDDGTECDYFSALPTIQGFADAAYLGDTQSPQLAPNFAGSCDATLASWLKASDIDIPNPAETHPGQAMPNASVQLRNPGKWLLWLDPVLDLIDITTTHATPKHYRELSTLLTDHATNGPAGDQRLGFVAQLSTVLAAKAELHHRLRPAYHDKDLDTVRDLTNRVIPTLEHAVDRLHAAHNRCWHNINKTFGWEIIEQRYAGLQTRLATLRDILQAWTDDPTQPIETLDIKQLPITGDPHLHNLRYTDVTTTCRNG